MGKTQNFSPQVYNDIMQPFIVAFLKILFLGLGIHVLHNSVLLQRVI